MTRLLPCALLLLARSAFAACSEGRSGTGAVAKRLNGVWVCN